MFHFFFGTWSQQKLCQLWRNPFLSSSVSLPSWMVKIGFKLRRLATRNLMPPSPPAGWPVSQIIWSLTARALCSGGSMHACTCPMLDVRLTNAISIVQSCSISIWWCEQLAVIRRSLWPFNQSCIFVSSCCQLASFHLLTYKLYSIVYMHSGWLIWSGKKQINTCINMGCIPKKRKRNSQGIYKK